MNVRFSIRFIFQLTCVSALLSALFWSKYHQRLEKWKAISRVAHEGGRLVFRDLNGYITDGKSYDNQIDAVYLTDMKLNSEDLSLFCSMPNVTRISFNNTNFDDTMVEALDRLRNLEVLQLNGTRISSFGLQHLAMNHNLKILSLNDTEVDDNATNSLILFKTLRKLSVRNTKFSSWGMSRLQEQMTSCEVDFGLSLDNKEVGTDPATPPKSE